MSKQTEKYCPCCGGPVKTHYIFCKYCGQTVEIEHIITDNDRKRIAVFAKIMDGSFYRNTIREEHKANRLFLWINSILFFLLSIFTYKTTGTFIYAGILLSLLTWFVLTVYFKVYWGLLNETSQEKIYKKKTEPLIEQFLQSFNYYGCDWDSVVSPMMEKNEILWMDDYLRPPKVEHKKDRTAIAVLLNLETILSNHIYARDKRKKTLFFLSAIYLLVFTLPVFSLFVPIYWIPLIWIMPVLAWLYLEITEKTLVLYKMKFKQANKKFLEKNISSVLRDYCNKTGHDFDQLIIQAKKLNFYYLYLNLSPDVPDICI